MALLSYAQNAEDVVLNRVFKDRSNGFYVDVGAGDPVLDSVTKIFSDRGWTGLNIEPEPSLYRSLSDDRVRDLNLDCAVAETEGAASLYSYTGRWGWSTISPEVHRGHLQSGQEPETREVTTQRLDNLLADAGITEAEFLKVDVEGSEGGVIRSIDFGAFRPRVIVVESTMPNTTTQVHASWEKTLIENGYRTTLFDGLNRFYISPHDREAASLISAPANSLDDFVPYKWWRLLDESTRAIVLEN